MTSMRRKFGLCLKLLRPGLSALAIGLLMAPIAAIEAAAQGQIIIYPSQGQTIEEQSRDESECRTWAQNQSGFNPAIGPIFVHSPQQGGEVVGGAARGALLGVVGGAIGGNAGRGAAIGAGVGATAGLMGRRRQQRDVDAANRQARADYDAGLATFNRAFAACMSGRGYTVN